MRAAVLEEFGQPLVVQELELAEPRAGEVLVRLVACGVCHTDMYTASGVDPSGYAPAVLGHEGAGVVEAIGEGVNDLQVGDHVVTLFSPQCRECVHCLSPKTNICLAIREQQGKGHLPDGTTRLSRIDGEPIRHFMGTSTFAEYTVMPEIALARRSRRRRRWIAHACSPAACRPGSARRCTRPRSSRARRCVVFGAGMVGLGAVAGARLQGADRIICVDLSEERLEMARHQGATRSCSAGRAGTGSSPRSSRRPAASAPTTRSRRPASSPSCARRSSRRAWAGAWRRCAALPARARRWTSSRACLITGRRVAGSSFGGVKGRDQVPQLVQRYLDGDIDVDAFLSHHITLDEVNKGFDLMHAQDGIRSVIGFG